MSEIKPDGWVRRVHGSIKSYLPGAGKLIFSLDSIGNYSLQLNPDTSSNKFQDMSVNEEPLEVSLISTEQIEKLVEAANDIYMIFRVFTLNKNRLKKMGNLKQALRPFTEVEDGNN